ncbi:MAG: TonB-dependent receptor [Bacteroidota bacterium]|nr:TonB-dependent receptor [Bacteroidota bacterium]
MKPILLIFLSLFLQLASAQSVVVSDSKTGKPVEGVVIYSGKLSVQTGKEGKADISKFKDEGRIIFAHSSYVELHTSFQNLWSANFVVRMLEDPVRIDEIVVSASRREQSRLEIPNKIITISRKDVDFQNPQTAADLLEYKSGVFVQKSQMGGGSPMIRGFSANRLLLVVDGIRMNNAIYRNGNLQNVISLDAGSIESTEVIFGPGSVIYGSDALGGVMSYQTLKPKLSSSEEYNHRGSVFFRYSGANSEKTIHGDVNFGLAKWAALASLTYTDFGDLRMGTNGPTEYLRPQYVFKNSMRNSGSDQIIENSDPRNQVYTGYSQFNSMLKLRFRPNEKLNLNYAFHSSKTSDIPRYDRLIQYSKDKLKYGDWYYGPQIWDLHSFQLGYTEKTGFFDRIIMLAGWQNYTESRFDRKLNKSDLSVRTENVGIFSLNVDLDKTINEKHVFYYGLEGTFNRIGSKGISRNLATGDQKNLDTRYPDGSHTSSLAAYISYNWLLSHQFTLHAGGRYTLATLKGKFSTEFYDFPYSEFSNTHDATTGNLGLVYHPTDNWQLNASVSTGFRSPNIDDMAKVFESTPGNVMVPNPDLKPEYARNIEFGIIRRFQKLAKFELDAFYTYLNDAMVRSDFSFNGKDSILYDGALSKVEALVNADYATIYGGSFSMELFLAPQISMKNSMSYTWGEDSFGDPIRHAAPFFGSSHLSYLAEKYKLDLYARFNGEISNANLSPSEKEKPEIYAIDANGQPYSPAWWTLNLKTSFLLFRNLSANVGLENILNKRYRPYSSGIVSAGRNLIVSLKYSL